MKSTGVRRGNILAIDEFKIERVHRHYFINVLARPQKVKLCCQSFKMDKNPTYGV